MWYEASKEMEKLAYDDGEVSVEFSLSILEAMEFVLS